MNRKWYLKLIGIILLAFMVFLPWSKPVQQYFSIPNEIQTFLSDNSINVPNVSKYIKINSEETTVLKQIDSGNFKQNIVGNENITYTAANIPIKKVNVSVLDDFRVVPGGQSIGINLETMGVLVVGHHQVETEGNKFSPGEEAEILVGDIILEVDNKKVKKMDEILPLVEKAGKADKALSLLVKRGNKEFTTTLLPAYDAKESVYRIGLFIRDSAAGIGTMTFHDPISKKYGALGHIISDMDTRKPVEINKGSIVETNIISIQKGKNGLPGEKQAEFNRNESKLGNINKNSPFGIFGKLEKEMTSGKLQKPMPITVPSQVKKGPAKILTVVDGDQVKAFDVEVVNSVTQDSPATKGMIIKITDPELLNKTGGIVQGMSGSPIIQDDKLIGAVTHVFVNDPTSGYGVHIEWMLKEAGIDIYQNKAS